MWARNYWANRFFAPRYWAKFGAEQVVKDRRSTTTASRVGSRDNWASTTQTGGF